MTMIESEIQTRPPLVRLTIDTSIRSTTFGIAPGLTISALAAFVDAVSVLVETANRTVNPLLHTDDISARATILRSTLQILSDTAPDQMQMLDVAREASVSRATVYRNFPGGRDELISAARNVSTARVEQIHYSNPLEIVLAIGAGTTAFLAIMRALRDWGAERRRALADTEIQELRVQLLRALADEVVQRVSELDDGEVADPLRIYLALDGKALDSALLLSGEAIDVDTVEDNR